jgi:sigma-54 dependent transcriptional regulator, acetoin dehydrogenase operon transcriptional activator AcoR
MTNPRAQSRPPSREAPPTLYTFQPLGKAVMEALTEGIVVYDPFGRLVYANQSARSAVQGLEDVAAQPNDMRQKVIALGGRSARLRHGTMDVGEALFLPAGAAANGSTLADRERSAILETLHVTRGRLAEAARRLGISRTTLWRRLRAYGVTGFRRPE